MGHKETSKTAFNALYKNFDLVERCCYEHNGEIENFGDNQKVIDALIKNRLAYFVDDNLDVRVHSKVRGLIDHTTSRYRLREKHGAFAGLIDDLEYNLTSYQKSKVNIKANNAQRFFDEVREIVMDIIELLVDTICMYNRVVLDDFSVSYDLDERIRETKRCKDELLKLNEIFEQLTVDKIYAWVGNDTNLEHLLMKVFKEKIDLGLKDLNGINLKLIERLDKLNRDKHSRHLNTLVDDFAMRFALNPGYMTDIKAIELPKEMSLPEGLLIGAYANLESQLDSYKDITDEIALNVNLKHRAKGSNTEAPETIKVTDSRSKTLNIELDEVNTAIEYLFEAIESDEITEDISVIKAHAILEVKISEADWLILVMNTYSSHRRQLKNHTRYQEISYVKSPYDGTVIVEDIVFKKL